MSSRGIKHENFFIAKICDSESARGAFGSRRLVTMISLAPCAHDERITKSTAVQAFPAILTIDNVDRSAFFASFIERDATLSRARPRTRLLLRVNTSLSGKLFFSMRWCYSRGSALRFPNARSD